MQVETQVYMQTLHLYLILSTRCVCLKESLTASMRPSLSISLRRRPGFLAITVLFPSQGAFLISPTAAGPRVPLLLCSVPGTSPRLGFVLHLCQVQQMLCTHRARHGLTVENKTDPTGINFQRSCMFSQRETGGDDLKRVVRYRAVTAVEKRGGGGAWARCGFQSSRSGGLPKTVLWDGGAQSCLRSLQCDLVTQEGLARQRVLRPRPELSPAWFLSSAPSPHAAPACIQAGRPGVSAWALIGTRSGGESLPALGTAVGSESNFKAGREDTFHTGNVLVC